jgi:hypothetical protein
MVESSETSHKNRRRVNSKVSVDGSPKPLGALRRNFAEMMNTPRSGYAPKNFSLKIPTTLGIANLGQEHYELGFIRKSSNRRPNLVFEESGSSTKRQKLTHDPLKKIRRETPSNRRIEG